jgi:hypothetical protein
MHSTEDESNATKDSFYEELEHVFDQFPRNHMKILIDFSADVRKEDITRPEVRNESLYEISNDNGVRVVNFAISKNLIVKSTTFPHHSIHKYTWTSPDVKMHNIDHVLIDKRQHSNNLLE